MQGRARLVTGVVRGRDSLTILTAEHDAHGVTVRAVVRQDVPHDADGAALTTALRATLAEARKSAGGLGCIISVLPARTAVVREAQFPILSQAELVAAIQTEARKHIPLDLRESDFDFQVVSHDEQLKAMHVLLVAVPRRNVVDLVTPLAQAGAEPWIVDIEPLAAVNALLHLDPLASDEALGLLEVGTFGSTFTLVTAEGHFLTRSVGSGYTADASGLGAASNISPQGAVSDRERRSAEADPLALDVRRTLTFFQQVTGRKPALRLRVVGPRKLRDQAAVRLSAALELTCTVPAPLDHVRLARGVVVPEELHGEAAMELLVALGLGLRVPIKAPQPAKPLFAINVYPDRARRKRRERKRMGYVVAASLVVAVNVFALGFLLLATRNLAAFVREDVAELERIKARTTQLAQAGGANGAARETLERARAARHTWSPALASVAASLPSSLMLTSVGLAGSTVSPDDSLGTTLTLRGIVMQAGSDPYAPVTAYVESLRALPDMQHAFPVIRLASTWEARTVDAVVRNFEIRCAMKEQMK
jgi:Tfp pilus assembly PilM family ATPase/Tfp pilus assembly protein PilN